LGISTAFRNSNSGLVATAKWAELTSSNIANANREDYVKRSLTTESTRDGGVLVTGIRREVNSSLDRLYRTELSSVSRQDVIASSLDNYSFALGDPNDSLSIAGQFSNLYAGFGLLANAPADPALQNNVLSSATGLSNALNDAADTLDQTLQSVTAGINNDVTTLNNHLDKIARLNTQIGNEPQPNARRASLQDQRALEIDALSALMNVNVSTKARGKVQLTTSGGTLLVDNDTAFKVSYDSSLGQLNVGNTEITPNKTGVRGFTEGRLAGRFDLKDNIIPQMKLQQDELARALIEGFQAADASLSPGQAGFFTDQGAAYNPAQLDGLAGRITVNAAVDPEKGGDLWRVRDGVGATSQGAASDSSQPLAFLNIFETPQSFDTQAGQGTSTDILDYIAGMVADQKLVQVDAKTKAEELDGKAQVAQSARQGIQGVNLDAELQQLILIEQSYAANAQVTQSLREMMDALLAAV
jgi:flagellar hook-associated protein 1 FlgK